MIDTRPSSEKQSPVLAICAAVWAIGFLLNFFRQPLPNNPTSRQKIWQLIRDDPWTMLNPLDYAASSAHKAGWQYLSQRLPFMITAAILLTAACGLGSIACRILLPRVRLRFSERLVIVFGVGLSLQSLWILACGLAGWLTPLTIPAPGIIALIVVGLSLMRRDVSASIAEPGALPHEKPLQRRWKLLLCFALLPFVLHIALGGFTPPFDFDVREYHLQGPKEWFQAGRIDTLEHNVYTSFPFLSEMLSLAAMVLRNDWWQGAIAGKLTLTAFQFLSAIAVFAIGRRWMGAVPGAVSAVAFLSTPWIVRISIIAYAEGAITFYLIASVMVALLAARTEDANGRIRLIAITGFLAGSAMASKYPGVVSVILPIGLFLFAAVIRRSNTATSTGNGLRRIIPVVCLNAAVFVATVMLAVGPWLLKNAVSTGNPVYPLAYSVFGANDWSPEMDAKWKRGHSASEHELLRIPQHLADAAIRNDWQNGFLFAFAVPAVLLMKRDTTVRWLWIHAFWLLGTWWLLTHRIDRFWIPVIPVTAVLAGAAWNISSTAVWRGFMIAALLVCSVFNYGISRYSPVIGFHVGLMDLETARELPIRPDLRKLNVVLRENSRVLMVGEAEVFDAKFNLVYNTVFDENIFEQWTSDDSEVAASSSAKRLKPAADISRLLKKNGITHIYVNWAEVLRYRLTYGYTDYVFPQRFQELQRAGILDLPMQLSAGDWNNLSEQQQRELMSWKGIESLRPGENSWSNIQLFAVKTITE